jgi:hypothetical protein
MTHLLMTITVALYAAVGFAGCTPAVRIEAPTKPIEINMNVKIEHEIRLKVEREVDELIANKKELF